MTEIINPNDEEKPDVEKRKTRLNLRLSDAELEIVSERAEGFGLPLAKFVRITLLDLPKPAKRIHDLPLVEPILLKELVSIGNNINQLTRYTHVVSNDKTKNLDVLSLAMALHKIGEELGMLRQHYAVEDNLTMDELE